jgi:hypothetical protein
VWFLIPAALLAAVGIVALGSAGSEAAKPIANLTAEGWPRVGTAKFVDVGSGGAASLWGSVDCVTPFRVERRGTGGDPEPRPDLRPQGSDGFRRLRVADGDNFYGERCELGWNNWPSSPVALYHEGEHLYTFLSYRLPDRFPLNRSAWQVVMQMKQTEPTDGGGFPTPVLALHAFDHRWRLYHTGLGNRHGADRVDQEVWSAPARTDTWVRFAFDVTYSQDPHVGSVRVYVDKNGDGDALDPGEHSHVMHLQTLAREQSGTDADGLTAGVSIPSHLRVGIYHDPKYRCVRNWCSIAIDNVGVYTPRPPAN